jgi:hypothetical protein
MRWRICRRRVCSGGGSVICGIVSFGFGFGEDWEEGVGERSLDRCFLRGVVGISRCDGGARSFEGWVLRVLPLDCAEDEELSFDDCRLCIEGSFGGVDRGYGSFLALTGSWMTFFDESRGGTIVRELPAWGLLSKAGLFSIFIGKERTLAERRCPSSTNSPYLSFRVCITLVRVGLGEGMPVTETGRGLARASRIGGWLEALTSRLGGVLRGGGGRLSFEGLPLNDTTDVFRVATGGELTGFGSNDIGRSFGMVSEMDSKPDWSLSWMLLTNC